MSEYFGIYNSCGLAVLAQQFEKLIHLPSVTALQHVQWQNADLASLMKLENQLLCCVD